MHLVVVSVGVLGCIMVGRMVGKGSVMVKAGSDARTGDVRAILFAD
jgi:hypothetical protein